MTKPVHDSVSVAAPIVFLASETEVCGKARIIEPAQRENPAQDGHDDRRDTSPVLVKRDNDKAAQQIKGA